jgi:hypothetical protein
MGTAKNKSEIKKANRQLPRFTISFLQELVKDDIIHLPLSDTDKIFLSMLHQIWGREKYARFFLQKIRKSKRHLLTIKPLGSKVDAYIFSRYYNAKKPLKVHNVANEVHVYFKVPYSQKLIDKIKKYRHQAQNAKYRHSKKPHKIIFSHKID